MDDEQFREVLDEVAMPALLDEGRSLAADARQLIATYFPVIQAIVPLLNSDELELVMALDESPVWRTSRPALPPVCRTVLELLWAIHGDRSHGRKNSGPTI